VGPYPSVASGGQFAPVVKGQERLFPFGRIPEGPAFRPRSARQTVQVLVLFEPVPRLWQFGFRLSAPPPATAPLTSGPGPTDHRGWETGAWCRQPFGFSSVTAEFKKASSFP
jgi:hypothetical protein